MCFFPLPNTQFNSLSYKKGVREFDCGSCPECLRKRSNVWALRSFYECRDHLDNCMVTLTYDDYIRDVRGNIVGELPPNPDLKVNQRDVQLFIKRLRKWHSSVSPDKIKYIACAEYGSRTHRAHYHLILFGVKFPDLFYYKKSKRGNRIYKSNILTKLWGHGICTVDSIHVGGAVARYCTKYCAKSRSDKTFMLTSQHIGLSGLMRDFNGLNYMVDGREHPVPRFVWENYIMQKYGDLYRYISPKYLNPDHPDYHRSCIQRLFYRQVRDSDPVYCRYLYYWRSRGEIFNRVRPDVLTRINLLDDRKFYNYKVAARTALAFRKLGVPVCAPNSGHFTAEHNWLLSHGIVTCRVLSRPNTASDTKLLLFGKKRLRLIEDLSLIPPSFVQSAQISLFD